MQILLFKGTGVISRLIRWQTRSEYSHAAVRFEDGWVFESIEGVGVRTQSGVHPSYHNVDCDIFSFPHYSAAGESTAREFAEDQVGKGYDYLSVLRFISRRQVSRASAGKWFCSEYAVVLANKVGCPLFRATEPGEVPPGLIARSIMVRMTGQRRGGWEKECEDPLHPC